MPWGKYRGRALEDVPLSYLAWCLDACDMRPPLTAAICAEVRRRVFDEDTEDAPPPPPPPPPPRGACPSPPVAHGLVSAGLRVLAMKHHPDHGGDTRLMQTVNACAAWLRGLAGGLR